MKVCYLSKYYATDINNFLVCLTTNIVDYLKHFTELSMPSRYGEIIVSVPFVDQKVPQVSGFMLTRVSDLSTIEICEIFLGTVKARSDDPFLRIRFLVPKTGSRRSDGPI